MESTEHNSTAQMPALPLELRTLEEHELNVHVVRQSEHRLVNQLFFCFFLSTAFSFSFPCTALYCITWLLGVQWLQFFSGGITMIRDSGVRYNLGVHAGLESFSFPFQLRYICGRVQKKAFSIVQLCMVAYILEFRTLSATCLARGVDGWLGPERLMICPLAEGNGHVVSSVSTRLMMSCPLTDRAHTCLVLLEGLMVCPLMDGNTTRATSYEHVWEQAGGGISYRENLSSDRAEGKQNQGRAGGYYVLGQAGPG